MTGYSIVLVSFSVAGMLVLLGLLVSEFVANFQSETRFAFLVKSGSGLDAEMARQAIRTAQEWTTRVPAEVKVAAEGQEFRESAAAQSPTAAAPGPIDGPTRKKYKEALETYAAVIDLLISELVAQSIDRQEFPVRAFTRHNWEDRTQAAKVILFFRAAREIRKAQTSNIIPGG